VQPIYPFERRGVTLLSQSNGLCLRQIDGFGLPQVWQRISLHKFIHDIVRSLPSLLLSKDAADLCNSFLIP
jgi:hypothetical protein